MTTSSLAATGRVSSSGTAAPRHRPGLVLSIIVAAQMMLIVDATVMTVALPKIQSDLHFSPTGLAWVLSAYTLTFGGLLLLGGRAGDLLGRRRTFIVGVAAFTLFSLVGGLSTSAWMLLSARALQGVGAAFTAPAAMSLIMTNFAEGHARNRALAVYATIASLGMAVGLILGGLLTAYLSWRWVLFINVPVGIAVLALTPRFIADTERHDVRIDLLGAFTATGGMASLVYAFIRASSSGWNNALTLGAFAAAAVLLTVFVLWQARSENPMLPLRLFKNRNRAAGYAAFLLIPACMFGVFFFNSQFLQDVRGYGALKSGLAFAPMAVAMFTTSRFTPRLLASFGARPLVIAGLAPAVAGIVWLAQMNANTQYFPGNAVPLTLVGIGFGLMFAPLTALILSGVPPRDSGAASGTLQTMQQGGGTLGLAILDTVYGTTLRNAGPHTPLRDAMAHGMSNAYTVGAVFICCAFVLIVAFIRTPRPAPAA